MRHHSLPIGVLAMGLLATATSAQAANESWVSGNGTDAGTCPRTAPCRTFQFAHDQTNNNGSINVLTDGNFGPLSITKPISVVADGVEAVINTASNSSAIQVNASNNAIVSLRGLTIDLRGTSNTAISFTTGGTLYVRDTVIRKASGGIYVGPSSPVEVYVSDTVISEISGTAGIFVQPQGGGSVKAVFDRVRVENGGHAGFLIDVSGLLHVIATIRDSVAAGNAESGIAVNGNPNVRVLVDRSTSINNGTIGVSGSGGALYIGDSVVSGNGTGLSGSGIISYETNQVDGNGTDGTPGGTAAMK